MQGSLDQPPIVVRGSRARSIGLLLICVPLVAFGVFAWRTAMGILDLALFGFLGAVALSLVILPSRLEVGPSGLTQIVLWRTRKLTWTDAYNFRPVYFSLSSKMIGFDYLKPRPNGLTQGRLSGSWEIRPDAVANLLNEARERWLVSADVTPHPLPTSPPQLQSSLAAALAGTRINRKVFWLATIVIFGIVVALSLVPPLRALIRYLTLFLFIRVYAARLHDFGRSAWWQVVLYVVQFAAVILIVAANSHFAGLAIAAGLLVQLAFTVVLGVIPGDREANQFGPPPDRPHQSPIAVSETFR